jgi:hypothetical protein
VNARSALTAVKLVHTLIWAFFAACILAIAPAAILGRYRWAALLSAMVLVECAVLAVNQRRCPLTDIASRYTSDRADNFDIYLPLWLARYNKQIFGILFIAAELLALACWVLQRTGGR